LPSSAPLLLTTARRGDSARFRENTLAAIQSAIDKKADIVEIDIRVTSDNTVIVLHDPTLDRLWGYPRKVSEVSAETVANLGFGEYRIPTLIDVINLFRETTSKLMIDMDDVVNAEPAFRVVQDSGVDLSQVIWCGNLEAMRTIRRSSVEARIWLPWNETGSVSEDLITAISPEYVNSHYSYWSGEKVEEVHNLGLKPPHGRLMMPQRCVGQLQSELIRSLQIIWRSFKAPRAKVVKSILSI
jgi:myo-inositol-1(or 4)-monophosphatase